MVSNIILYTSKLLRDEILIVLSTEKEMIIV